MEGIPSLETEKDAKLNHIREHMAQFASLSAGASPEEMLSLYESLKKEDSENAQHLDQEEEMFLRTLVSGEESVVGEEEDKASFLGDIRTRFSNLGFDVPPTSGGLLEEYEKQVAGNPENAQHLDPHEEELLKKYAKGE
jgi:hypothetical protein